MFPTRFDNVISIHGTKVSGAVTNYYHPPQKRTRIDGRVFRMLGKDCPCD